VWCALALTAASAAMARPPRPKPGFGADGVATAEFAADATARAMALAPDRGVVVAGNAGGEVALARFTADGTLDSSFGDQGRVSLDLGGTAQANGVAVAPGGETLVAGSVGPDTDGNFAPFVLRLLSNGTLDPGFGSGGFGELDPTLGYAADVAIQPDGGIVVVGSGGPYAVVERLLPDGTPDPSFGGGDGTQAIQIQDQGPPGPSSDSASSVALDPQGEIVLAGTSFVVPEAHALFASLAPDGAVTAAFALGNGRDFSASDVAFMADGSPLLVGKLVPYGTSASTIEAWDVGPTVSEYSFTPPPGPIGDGYASASAVASLADGRAVVAASGQNGFGERHYNLFLFDVSGGLGRHWRTPLEPADLAVYKGRRIVVAGTKLLAGTERFAAARYRVPRLRTSRKSPT